MESLQSNLGNDQAFKFAIGIALFLSIATSVITILKYFEEKEIARKKLSDIN